MSNSAIINILQSQKGNGIIYVILISAIIVINGFIGLTYVNNEFNDVRNWSIFRAKTDINRSISGTLRNSENCLATFTMVNSTTTNEVINSIKGDTGNSLFESISVNADATYGSGRFQISEMRIKNFSTHPLDANSRVARFSVSLQSGNPRDRHLEYPILLTFDAMGSLIYCSYIDETKTVWKKNAAGDLYLNNSVGIGHPQVTADFISWGNLALRNSINPNLSLTIKRSYMEANLNGTSFVIDASSETEDPVIFSPEKLGGIYAGYSFANLTNFPFTEGNINIKSTTSPHLRLRKPNATTGWNMNATTSELVWEYKNNDGTDAAGTPNLLIKTNNSTLNAFRDIRIGEVNNYGLNFYVGGNAGGTTSFSSLSDKRLKKDLKLLSSKESLKKIKQLKIYYYRLKDGDIKNQKQVGVMAQEILEYLPEVVSQSSDGYSTVDYSQFVPLTSSAMRAVDSKIKQQNKILDELLKNL